MCKTTCDSYCTRISPKEQHRIVRDIFQNDYLVAGSKRFILSAVWWRKWCDYVNYSQDSKISMDESFNTFSFYDKPSYIENKYLLDSSCRLFNEIVEHFDYVVVPQEVW